MESVKSNTEKEVWEETGLEACAARLIAVQDRNKHNVPVYAYGVCKIFVFCTLAGGEFKENIETTEIGWFSLSDLPQNLAEEKTTRKQIEMCFLANENANWQVFFD